MRSAEVYAELARTLPFERFVDQCGSWFLTRSAAGLEGAWDDSIEFQTSYAVSPLHLGSVYSPATDLAVVGVRKRLGNPYPERISIGRSRTCDVVIRVAHVSKLHAHFLVDRNDTLRLVDQRSANGTFVSGRRISPAVPSPVTSGTRLSFGGFECELLVAAQLVRRLMAK